MLKQCLSLKSLSYVTHDISYDRAIQIHSNAVPHGLCCDIVHHLKAVCKCTISWYVKSRKYGPYLGIYINIAKTGIVSLYFKSHFIFTTSQGFWKNIGLLVSFHSTQIDEAVPITVIESHLDLWDGIDRSIGDTKSDNPMFDYQWHNSSHVYE